MRQNAAIILILFAMPLFAGAVGISSIKVNDDAPIQQIASHLELAISIDFSNEFTQEGQYSCETQLVNADTGKKLLLDKTSFAMEQGGQTVNIRATPASINGFTEGAYKLYVYVFDPHGTQITGRKWYKSESQGIITITAPEQASSIYAGEVDAALVFDSKNTKHTVTLLPYGATYVYKLDPKVMFEALPQGAGPDKSCFKITRTLKGFSIEYNPLCMQCGAATLTLSSFLFPDKTYGIYAKCNADLLIVANKEAFYAPPSTSYALRRECKPQGDALNPYECIAKLQPAWFAALHPGIKSTEAVQALARTSVTRYYAALKKYADYAKEKGLTIRYYQASKYDAEPIAVALMERLRAMIKPKYLWLHGGLYAIPGIETGREDDGPIYSDQGYGKAAPAALESIVFRLPGEDAIQLADMMENIVKGGGEPVIAKGSLLRIKTDPVPGIIRRADELQAYYKASGDSLIVAPPSCTDATKPVCKSVALPPDSILTVQTHGKRTKYALDYEGSAVILTADGFASIKRPPAFIAAQACFSGSISPSRLLAQDLTVRPTIAQAALLAGVRAYIGYDGISSSTYTLPKTNKPIFAADAFAASLTQLKPGQRSRLNGYGNPLLEIQVTG